MIDGVGSPVFSALSIPPIEAPPRSCREEVIQSSREQFSSPRGPIEEAITAELKINPDAVYEEPEPKRKTTTYRPKAPQGGGAPAPTRPRPRPALPPMEAEAMLPEHGTPDRQPRQNTQGTPPRRPMPQERPAPAAGAKTAEDLRSILRRMTEEANKGKAVKAAEKQAGIQASVAEATRPAPPQAPAQPRPQPVPQAAPAPAPRAAEQPAPAKKPFEVPEADLRNLFKEDI
jgi:hypothetical protein